MHRRCCQQAASSVHYTTSCKHSLVLLRMGEIIARNMLSRFKLLINCYYCIYLVVYNKTECLVFLLRFEHGTPQNSSQKPRAFHLLTAHTWWSALKVSLNGHNLETSVKRIDNHKRFPVETSTGFMAVRYRIQKQMFNVQPDKPPHIFNVAVKFCSKDTKKNGNKMSS